MVNKDRIYQGMVEEIMGGGFYQIKLDDKDKMVRCYLAGRMKLYKIWVIVGDSVEIFLPTQSKIGRITKRL